MDNAELLFPSEICKKLGEDREEFFKLESGRMSTTSVNTLRNKNPEKYKIMMLGLIC